MAARTKKEKRGTKGRDDLWRKSLNIDTGRSQYRREKKVILGDFGREGIC